MPTKAELKKLAKPIKLKIRKGDKVLVISGKDKGQIGFVAAVAPRENKVLLLKDNPENPEQPLPLNRAVKHRKAKQQGEKSARFVIPVPVDVSNVMVLDDKGNPTRIGRRRNEAGKLERYAKTTGAAVVDAPVMEKGS